MIGEAVQGVSSLIVQPIYDTVQLTASANQTATFFTIPVGGLFTAAIPKTKLHTNLVQSGRLEAGYAFTITGISFSIKQTVAAGTAVTRGDYDLIYRSGWLDLQLGQVSFLQVPLNCLPPASQEIGYFSNITPAATEFRSSHGIPAASNKFDLSNQPLQIEPQTTLQAFLNVADTVVAVTDVLLVLHGILIRPVR